MMGQQYQTTSDLCRNSVLYRLCDGQLLKELESHMKEESHKEVTGVSPRFQTRLVVPSCHVPDG